MATSIGAQLTGALLDRLSGRHFARHSALVIPIAAADPAGWPHLALVSYSALVARDRGALRLAFGGRSGSADNLRRNGHLATDPRHQGESFVLGGIISQSDPEWVARRSAVMAELLADVSR